MTATPDSHDRSPSSRAKLVDCSACHKQVSKTAILCPHCGQLTPGAPVARTGMLVEKVVKDLMEIFGSATIRGWWSRIPLRVKACLLVFLLTAGPFVIACAVHMNSDRVWHEINESVTTGDLTYKILFRCDDSESPFPWSGPKLRWQTIVIAPRDRTRERLKALDQQLRRDNAGIWSLSIDAYDDETAARRAWQITHGNREKGPQSGDSYFAHYVGNLIYMDGLDEKELIRLDESAGY
jgi:hypothetical protein